jgi:lipid-A-disaccharide synthase-like uncharacterized protein
MVVGRIQIPHPGLVVLGLACLVGMAVLANQIDAHDAGLSKGWLAFGFGAQLLFMARFLVQWLASEKAKKTVVPVSFWWLSLLGGLSLGVYFMQRGDPVAIMGQMFPTLVYLRNLWLIYAERKHEQPPAEEGELALEGEFAFADTHGAQRLNAP